MLRVVVIASLVVGSVALPGYSQGSLEVVDVSPARHSLVAPLDAEIVVEFDRPIDRASVTGTSFWGFGRWSGTVAGSFEFSDGDRAVTLVPDRPFSAGETVMVILSNRLRAMDGTFLRSAGYSYEFWTRSRGTGFRFAEIDRFSTRSSPEVTTRAYGGFGSDLNGDGALDLTIVNEDTNDLRTFLNRGNRSGTFRDMLEPVTPVGNVPSPSEPSDFNLDGNVDVAVANTQGASVSILLGNGDGTFGAAQTLGVGGEPRGIAVLDADGDGDADVAATTFADGRVTVLFNDGDGRFGSPRSFGTGRGERALAAGDMNDDGVLDLVVGTLISREVYVYTGNGDGSFTRASSRPSGGRTWMLVLGDVDGDRDEDVVVVNSESDNGAVLLGNGRGRLAAPRMQPTDPFPLATDLGDLDGDGDLDWVTSSFNGDWMLFENDGDGAFSLRQTFAASRAASCSIPMDIDNDGALDLVLIDELEDEVVLMASRAVGFASDFESGDTADWSKTRGSLVVIEPGLAGSDHALAVTADGTRARSFVESRHPAKESSWSVSFELDADGIDLQGAEIEILRLGSRRKQAVLTLADSGNGLRARLYARTDGGLAEVGETGVPRDGEVRLGVAWAAASAPGASDGRAALLKNGRLRAAVAALANAGQVINKVRLGLPAGSRGAGNGTFLVDEYISAP